MVSDRQEIGTSPGWLWFGVCPAVAGAGTAGAGAPSAVWTASSLRLPQASPLHVASFCSLAGTGASGLQRQLSQEKLTEAAASRVPECPVHWSGHRGCPRSRGQSTDSALWETANICRRVLKPPQNITALVMWGKLPGSSHKALQGQNDSCRKESLVILTWLVLQFPWLQKALGNSRVLFDL